MAKKYAGASEDQIDLLNKMLQFNPYFRVSIEDALAHPCFKKIRKPAKETNAPKPIVIDFEDQPLDKDTLRGLFLRIQSEVANDPHFRGGSN